MCTVCTQSLTHSVCGASGKNIPNDRSRVSAAADPEAEPVAIVGQNDHLNLSPLTLKLQLEVVTLDDPWVRSS